MESTIEVLFVALKLGNLRSGQGIPDGRGGVVMERAGEHSSEMHMGLGVMTAARSIHAEYW